jgi:hypothetical protein
VSASGDVPAQDHVNGAFQEVAAATLSQVGTPLFCEFLAFIAVVEYDTPMRKLLAHAHTPAAPIRELRGQVDQELNALIDRLMAKGPNDRFAEPSKLISALEGFTEGSDLCNLLKSIDIPLSYGGSPPSSTEAASN